MEKLLKDIRYGVRVLMRKPGLTAVAVLALAIGTGANTALFSVINGVLLQPLPYPDPEQLVQVWSVKADNAQEHTESSMPNFIDWRDQNQVFSEMAAYSSEAYNLTGAGEPERISAMSVSASFFPLLGVQPVMGRGFLPEDEQPGANPSVIISHALWQQRFGSDPEIIGKTIALDSESHTVKGVLPPGFRFSSATTHIWVPLTIDNDSSARLSLYLGVIGRLKQGITLDKARADLNTIASRLEQQYPSTNSGWGISLVSMHEEVVGNARPMLMILLGAVGFVLLIACANVANLLLAQGIARRKEIAIRVAMGAGRLRVVRQLLTESIMLSLAGGSLGLLLALWEVDALISLSPNYIPRTQEITIDMRVLGFTLAISILTGLVFGLIPALQASRTNLNESLKEGATSVTVSGSRQRLRGALVVSEVALALVLLIGAGLLLKSFISLQRVETGFDPKNVLVMNMMISVTKYQKPAEWSSFLKQTLDRLEVLPGVESVGVASSPPLGRYVSFRLFNIEGRPPKSQQDYTASYFRVVSPGYFHAMRIPILEGRDFSERDHKDAPIAVIINKEMARRFWPAEDPLGKRIKVGTNPDSNRPWMTVAGIIGDVKSLGLEEAAEPEMYVSYLQLPQPYTSIVARIAGDPLALASTFKQEIQAVDSEQPVANITSMERMLSNSIADRRFMMTLIDILASMSLLLAAVGLYGVMSHAITQRTREIGIRQALGAQRKDILKMVMRQGFMLALMGVGIGLAGAFALTRFLSSMLFNVSTTDPLTFAAISLLLLGVALLASYIPARRATKVDPIVALRYE